MVHQQQQQQQDETRKGPWTEQEDFQLVCFVGLFGDRRWDFIAKVSGLNRTGKSCRLRWVNYLHPGLKRGKMTPHEERLVLDLHAKWGNRWSRIARKLPGRTDNEIKNYWRTHMRKKAQEKKKRNGSSSSSSSSPSSSSASASISPSSSSSNITAVESLPFPPESSAGVESFYDTGGINNLKNDDTKPVVSVPVPVAVSAPEYSMDDIWEEISLPVTTTTAVTTAVEAPAAWGVQNQDQFYCSDSLWKMDDDEASHKLSYNYNYYSSNDNNNTGNQFMTGFGCLGFSEGLIL